MEEALRDLVDDITDREDMSSPSVNPGLKNAVSRAQALLPPTLPKFKCDCADCKAAAATAK
jgi:hypothetical protein